MVCTKHIFVLFNNAMSGAIHLISPDRELSLTVAGEIILCGLKVCLSYQQGTKCNCLFLRTSGFLTFFCRALGSNQLGAGEVIELILALLICNCQWGMQWSWEHSYDQDFANMWCNFGNRKRCCSMLNVLCMLIWIRRMFLNNEIMSHFTLT